jgi:hypothetical protein
MKRIVIIVPDQVKIINETSSNIYSKHYDVTEDLIIQMFSSKTDYHENIFFEDTKSIRVESIEDVN